MRAEMEATRRRLGLLEKLERAAMARKEAVEARLAGMPQVGGLNSSFTSFAFCFRLLREEGAGGDGQEGSGGGAAGGHAPGRWPNLHCVICFNWRSWERAALARKEAVEARLAGMPQVPLIFFLFVFFSCATRVWDGRQWRGWWRKAFKCEPESANLKCQAPSASLPVRGSKCEAPSSVP